MSQIAFKLRLIAFLCLATVASVENESSIQQDILPDENDFLPTSLLPWNLNLLSKLGGLDLSVQPDSKEEQVVRKKIKQVVFNAHRCSYCTGKRRHKKIRIHQEPQQYTRYTPHIPRVPKGTFILPIDPDQFWISSYYGRRSRGRMHKGIDLAAIRGTPVRACASGSIEMAGTAGTFGKMVLIRHANGYKTRYAHLRKIAIPGGYVSQGQVIGYVGNTGRVSGATGDHLHLEILDGRRPVNPIRFF